MRDEALDGRHSLAMAVARLRKLQIGSYFPDQDDEGSRFARFFCLPESEIGPSEAAAELDEGDRIPRISSVFGLKGKQEVYTGSRRSPRIGRAQR